VTFNKKIWNTNTADSNAGQLQNWENLSRQSGAFVAQDITKGAYNFWVPENLNQSAFVTPDAMDDVSYPVVVVSGQLNTQALAPLGPDTEWIRVIVITNYEVTTTSPLIDTETCPGDTAEFERCLAVLNTLPVAVENPLHLPFIRNVLSKLKSAGMSLFDFVDNNKSWLLPVAKAAGTAIMAL